MRQSQGFNAIIFGGASVLMALQPAVAAPVQVTAVRVNPTSTGVDVVLQTQSGDRPQVFAVNRGNSWTADVTNSQLRLPGGKPFRQEKPAPGISMVTVTPIDANSIRVTVVGQKGTPLGKITRPSQGGLVFSLAPSGFNQAATLTTIAPKAPTSLPPVPRSAPIAQTPVLRSAPIAQTPVPSAPLPTPTPQPAVPATPAPQPVTPAPFPVTPNLQTPTRSPAPLVPNPEITVQGPATPAAPPLLPRAIAPPVGDISAAQIDASASAIDLGTAERVPRLVLREAPAREVLSLLARAAGLNIAYTDAPSATPGQPPAQQPPGSAATPEGPKITLDIENESVQDVFNYVLRLSGLEANRVGRTIFVGPKLPNSARNLVVRSLRLNQVPVASALNFLVALGAESAVSRERLVTSVNAVPVAQLAGGGAQSAITQTQTTTETRVETQRVNYIDSNPILRGLQVSGDERTNQVTLTGSARQVEIAIAQLTQLDVRRRQVVVNVRVIDVNLLSSDRFGASFSFGIDSFRFISEGGVALLNLGRRAPASSGLAPADVPSLPAVGTNSSRVDFVRTFFAQLQAAVNSGNAKILTDPTLLVQEGQTATVNLTQEVVTNLRQQVTATQNSTQVTIDVEKARAGLILPIRVDRIDDNGFIALSIAPSVTRPDDEISIQIPGVNGGAPTTASVTLLSERRLESGQIRLRDGQTLLVSGIIEDQDRVTSTKVPILGDIPLLGALFRRTVRDNQRREVIVLVTPRVLDDSDRSTTGYSYTPSPAVREVLEQGNRP